MPHTNDHDVDDILADVVQPVLDRTTAAPAALGGTTDFGESSAGAGPPDAEHAEDVPCADIIDRLDALRVATRDLEVTLVEINEHVARVRGRVLERRRGR